MPVLVRNNPWWQAGLGLLGALGVTAQWIFGLVPGGWGTLAVVVALLVVFWGFGILGWLWRHWREDWRPVSRKTLKEAWGETGAVQAQFAEYRQRTELVMELRQMAQHLTDEWNRLMQVLGSQEQSDTSPPFDVSERIQWFSDYSNEVAKRIEAVAPAMNADKYRVRRDDEGHLHYPPIVDHVVLESHLDLVNVLSGYSHKLSQAAGELVASVRVED